jgi:hypothetical protein
MHDLLNGSYATAKNYRPISITAMCMYEQIILKRLLVNHKLGFRAKMSTRDNLVLSIQKICEAFNKKRKGIAIFFDIEVPFDNVKPAGLI